MAATIYDDQPIALTTTATSNNPLGNPLANPDVLLAFDTLREKARVLDKYWTYYTGDAVPPAITKKLQDLANKLQVYVHENWSEMVIEALSERITLTALTIAGDAPDEQAQKMLTALVTKAQLLLEADDAHRSASIAGHSYLIVWRNSGLPSGPLATLDTDNEDDEIQIYLNDARMCHLFYRSDNPKKARVAAKWWIDEAGKRRLTLYYPERVEMWISTSPAKDLHDGRNFIPLDNDLSNLTIPNPFGMIPVFHFQPDRLVARSDLKSVIPIQNGITSLVVNLMTSAEFDALPQKYVITSADMGSDGQMILPSGPGVVWEIPGGGGLGEQGTAVGQFQAGNLSNFITAIEHFVNVIATITRIPKHFFFSQGGDPSGEALIAMEAPLTKKATRRIDGFTPVWQQVGSFMLRLMGYEIESTEIQAEFDSPETVQPKTQMEIVQTGVGAGIPLVTMLRDLGWTQARIDRMLAEKREEQAQAAKTLADALAQKSAQFDRSGGESDDKGSSSNPPSGGKGGNSAQPEARATAG